MEMRYIQDVSIEKAIIHILDLSGDEPILNEYELDITERVYEFLHKQIVKGLNDFNNFKGKFYSNEGIMYQEVYKAISEEESFIESSKKIASHLFNILKKYDGIDSCDLIVCKFTSDGMEFLALLKLDYQTSFTHDIDFEDDKFKIRLVTQETGLPGMKQKLNNSAYLKLPSDDYYDMMYVEKPFKTVENEIIRYFLEEFLQASQVVDHTGATQIVKGSIEKWVRKNYKDEIDKAIEIRDEVNEAFLNNGTIDIETIASNITDSNEERERFIEELERKGVNISESVDIDKKWVEKKMKSKQIKTDTGFVLKGDFDFFNDNMRFEIKYNGDGSVNYIIKNVRNISER